MANTIGRKQTLTRAKLIELRNLGACSRWRLAIDELLKPHFAKTDDFQIEIAQHLIEELMSDGTKEQQILAKKAGLKLRRLQRHSEFDAGQIMRDEDGDLLLVVDDGVVDLRSFQFYSSKEYDLYGKLMPKDFRIVLLNGKPEPEEAK
jgi:hypothetical protein